MRLLALVTSLSVASAFDWINPRYWQLQAETAKLIGAAVRRGNAVLEVDAVDGAKNLYYLPLGCSVTQWVGAAAASQDLGPTRQAAAKNGLGLEIAKTRSDARPPKLAAGAFDAALTLGALGRARDRGGLDAAAATAEAALAALRPDGLLVFVEDAASEATLAACLDESPLVAECDARVEHGAILGVARRAPDAKKKGFKA